MITNYVKHRHCPTKEKHAKTYIEDNEIVAAVIYLFASFNLGFIFHLYNLRSLTFNENLL
jgi:hypothetical protein